METKKNEWEPTDSQGYSMQCVKCGVEIFMDHAEHWDNEQEADCPMES